MRCHYAHSRPDLPVERWHTLEEHLQGTAGLAESFAAPFAPGWGRLAGLWHDAGKYQADFQRRRAEADAFVSEVLGGRTILLLGQDDGV